MQFCRKHEGYVIDSYFDKESDMCKGCADK